MYLGMIEPLYTLRGRRMCGLSEQKTSSESEIFELPRRPVLILLMQGHKGSFMDATVATIDNASPEIKHK